MSNEVINGLWFVAGAVFGWASLIVTAIVSKKLEDLHYLWIVHPERKPSFQTLVRKIRGKYWNLRSKIQGET